MVAELFPEKKISRLRVEHESADGYITEFQKYFEEDYAGTEFETILFEIVYALRGMGYHNELIDKYIHIEA